MTEQQQTEERAQAYGQCICGGAGPALSDFLKRLGPSEPVRRHFDQARIEFLKGLRTLIDERIQTLSQSQSKGTKVTVE